MSKRYNPDAGDELQTTLANQAPKKGTIWKIDRFATHDGPGIRTTLYFKGCPLRCKWCCNPEGQVAQPTLVLIKADCSGCGLCIEACPTHAIEMSKPTDEAKATAHVERSKCNSCGDCTPSCPSGALKVWGREYSISDVLEILEKDRLIHSRSGGGLTCTGGEPLYQPEFLQELLAECHRRGIHTVVETSAYADEETFKAVLQVVDWLFVDLKHMNSSMHKLLTGGSNEVILRNVQLASSVLRSRGKNFVIRMVVIPDVNDGQNISDLSVFLRSLPSVTMVELLPYHCYGVYKYDLLGRRYNLDTEQPSAEEMEKYRKLLSEHANILHHPR